MTEVGDVITVCLPVWAEYSIRVTVTEEMLEENEGGVDMDAVLEEAYDQLPSGLCHQCSTGNTGAGWGQESAVYLEIGATPEPKYAMNEEGKTVWGDPDEKMGW